MSISSRLASVKDHLAPMSTSRKSPITCHVLVASVGKPGRNVGIKIEKMDAATGIFTALATSQTNEDGRCPNLLPDDYKVDKGVYRITFETKEFFARTGENCFYPYVQIAFELTSPEQHYHIPLLISPYSYTTYRGS